MRICGMVWSKKNAQNSVLILLPFSWKLLFLYFFLFFAFFGIFLRWIWIIKIFFNSILVVFHVAHICECKLTRSFLVANFVQLFLLRHVNLKATCTARNAQTRDLHVTCTWFEIWFENIVKKTENIK